MTVPVAPIEALAANQGHLASTKWSPGGSPGDAQAFSDLLARHKAQLPGPSPALTEQARVSEPGRSRGVDPAGQTTAGDKILRSLERMGGELRDSWNDIQLRVVADTSSLDTHGALALQWHMIKMSVHYEAMGKAIGKTAQNVDQLVRMQ